MNEFDNFNGFLIEKGEKLFNTGNRSFKYGDGLFETIKVVDGKVMYWDDHYERLKKGIDLLKLDDSKISKEKWEQEIERIVYRNNYKFAKIRVAVYRESPGLYTPLTNKIGFVIEGRRLEQSDLMMVEEGIEVGLYEEVDKPVHVLANCKTSAALVYVLAALDKKEKGLDDVVVLNNKGNVCETSNANIFFVKDGKVFTPALGEGCIAGVMRKQIIASCSRRNIALEEGSYSIEDLKQADEIFLSNVIVGVKPVKKFLDTEKSSELSLKIQEEFKLAPAALKV